MNRIEQPARRLEITIHEHKVTHLLIATCTQMPGLYVAARSAEQIVRELPGAIRELLEAEGKTVISVTTEEPTRMPSGFEVRTLVANALVDELAHA